MRFWMTWMLPIGLSAAYLVGIGLFFEISKRRQIRVYDVTNRWVHANPGKLHPEDMAHVIIRAIIWPPYLTWLIGVGLFWIFPSIWRATENKKVKTRKYEKIESVDEYRKAKQAVEEFAEKLPVSER